MLPWFISFLLYWDADKDQELGEAHIDIKALRLSGRLREKGFEEVCWYCLIFLFLVYVCVRLIFSKLFKGSLIPYVSFSVLFTVSPQFWVFQVLVSWTFHLSWNGSGAFIHVCVVLTFIILHHVSVFDLYVLGYQKFVFNTFSFLIASNEVSVSRGLTFHLMCEYYLIEELAKLDMKLKLTESILKNKLLLDESFLCLIMYT